MVENQPGATLTLAAQNVDLVRAVDELQRRTRLLGALLGLALLIGAGALAATLLR